MNPTTAKPSTRSTTTKRQPLPPGAPQQAAEAPEDITITQRIAKDGATGGPAVIHLGTSRDALARIARLAHARGMTAEQYLSRIILERTAEDFVDAVDAGLPPKPETGRGEPPQTTTPTIPPLCGLKSDAEIFFVDLASRKTPAPSLRAFIREVLLSYSESILGAPAHPFPDRMELPTRRTPRA